MNADEYNGHIFWDAELWVGLALLPLFPSLTRLGLQYRYNRLQEAKAKARANKYAGAMWPWESAFSGIEVTPTNTLTGALEQHISGDIVLAALMYDRLHRDSAFRTNVLCPLAVETAEYWASRVEEDAKGWYHVLGVISPDEYAFNVSDDLFTNAVAAKSLQYAAECSLNETWKLIAERMHIWYDARQNWHPQYVGYKVKQRITQASAVLAAYPLEFLHNESTNANNLKYYKSVTDGDGPAMTWSIHFIQALRLAQHEFDVDRAFREYFNKAFKRHVKGPYHVWWERLIGGATHFAAGAGGYLQMFIFGLCGLHINYNLSQPHVLALFQPYLPQHLIPRLMFNGVLLISLSTWLLCYC